MATQVTVITGQGSTSYSVSAGARGPQGIQGEVGPPGTTDYNELDNVPSEFPPESHTHAVSDIVSISSNRLLGRHAGGSGAGQEVTVGSGLEFQGSGIRRSALTGDVTASAGSNSTTIANDAVTNAKLANVATATIKGRITAGTGDPEDLTPAQALEVIGAETPAGADAKIETLRLSGTRYDWMRGNLSKLDAKTRLDPSYRAKVLYLGDSLIDLMSSIIRNKYQGHDLRIGAEWNKTVSFSTAGPAADYTKWPSGGYRRLADGTPSTVFALSAATVPMKCSRVNVGYIATNGAGTFSVSYGATNSGPWTTLAASVNADNGSTAAGVLVSYDVPDGSWFVKLERVSGEVDIVVAGLENPGCEGGLFWIAVGGLDLGLHFINTPQAILAPIVNAFDPDVIYWDSADAYTDTDANLENYIGKLTADMTVKPGVILVSRNPWLGGDAIQKQQAESLRTISLANGWGYYDMAALLYDGATADANGLVIAGGNVHLSDEGMDLKLQTLTDRWPTIWDLRGENHLETVIQRSEQPITLLTFAEAQNLYASFTPVEIGIATRATTTGGSTSAANGFLTTTINSSVTSGSAKAVLRTHVASGFGTGAGTRFMDGTVAFIVEVIGRSMSSATHRVFIGADGYDLAAKGFGIEWDTAGVYLIAHDGTTRVASAAMSGAAILSATIKRVRYMVECTGGVVTCYRYDVAGTKASRLIGTLAGGPTGVGGSTDHSLLQSSVSTGVSNVNTAQLMLSYAAVR